MIAGAVIGGIASNAYMATGRDTVTTADMRRPIMADTHHTMVTDTAIGECIVRHTLTMVVRTTMAVGTGAGVTTENA